MPPMMPVVLLKKKQDDTILSGVKKQKRSTKWEATVYREVGSHPHIVSVLAEGGEEGHEDEEYEIQTPPHPQDTLGYWIALEKMDACLIDIVGTLPLQDRIRYGRQIGSGLSQMHRKGYRHNDLKLDNVLVDLRTRTAKLCDMEHSSLLKEGRRSGSLSYMAPELFLGRSGETSDSWSLGVCLFSLLHIHLPFEKAKRGDDAFDHVYSFPGENGWYEKILSFYSERETEPTNEVRETSRRPTVMDQKDWAFLSHRETILDLLLTKEELIRPRVLDTRVQFLLGLTDSNGASSDVCSRAE